MERNALDKIESGTTSGLYAGLIASLDAIGRYEVEVKKTSLHITHGRAFLGVHPRRDDLLLNIVTQEPLDGPRIKRSARLSANRFHNETIVTSTDDLDGELLGWLKSAYDLTT
jgi:hypothetical protein